MRKGFASILLIGALLLLVAAGFILYFQFGQKKIAKSNPTPVNINPQRSDHSATAMPEATADVKKHSLPDYSYNPINIPPLFSGVKWNTIVPIRLIIINFKDIYPDGSIMQNGTRVFFEEDSSKSYKNYSNSTVVGYPGSDGKQINIKGVENYGGEVPAYSVTSELLPLPQLGYAPATEPHVAAFYAYYDSELRSRGYIDWQGGDASGVTGEQRGYEKNSHYFVLGENIVQDKSSSDQTKWTAKGIQVYINYN